MKSKLLSSSMVAAATLACCLSLGAASFVGCERKERVLDVQTPEGSLQVDRNIDTGEVDVEVTDND
jgi:hypothetical protein